MLKQLTSFTLFILLALLVLFAAIEKPVVSKEFTLTPFFRIIGKFTQTADVTFSRVLATGDWDEAQFGDKLKSEFNIKYPVSVDSIYLNNMARILTENSRKDFQYRIYVDYDMGPNAFAMAGGVIVFSAELLELLENEAQVAAILSHEIAHVELDHCVNAIKFELAKDKYKMEVPDLFSMLYDALIGISFSKNQEDEADDYAFNLIVRNTDYLPTGLSEAFTLFIEEFGKDEDKVVLKEFFQSHPDMAYRRDKFYARAANLNLEDKKYCGEINLLRRKDKSDLELDSEWLYF